MAIHKAVSDVSNMTHSLRNLQVMEKEFSELVKNYSTINENARTIENISHDIQNYCNKGCQYVQKNLTLRRRYRSCLELLKCGFNKSGRYIVEPWLGYKKEVFCNQLDDGGGWTVFLRNRYGNISFYKSWVDYKYGFGDLDYDFWLGNEFLFKATTLYNLHESNTTQLYVNLVDKANTNFYVKYKNFAVLPESTNYRLHISGHMYGTAGDSLEYHNNAEFSTKDKDNDISSSRNCAALYDTKGGWWFKSCRNSHLSSTLKDYYNPYLHKYTPAPIWYHVHNNRNLLRSATMMFREKT